MCGPSSHLVPAVGRHQATYRQETVPRLSWSRSSASSRARRWSMRARAVCRSEVSLRNLFNASGRLSSDMGAGPFVVVVVVVGAACASSGRIAQSTRTAESRRSPPRGGAPAARTTDAETTTSAHSRGSRPCRSLTISAPTPSPQRRRRNDARQGRPSRIQPIVAQRQTGQVRNFPHAESAEQQEPADGIS